MRHLPGLEIKTMPIILLPIHRRELGPYLSMKEALDNSGLNATDISYINAHGTGTENNDETESRAMIRTV